MAIGWFTEGLKTNPASGTLLATSGSIPGPRGISPQLFLSSTVGITLLFQQLDSNNAVVNQHTIILSVGTNVFPPPAEAIQLLPGDDNIIRVITSGLIVGQVQVSLFLPS